MGRGSLAHACLLQHIVVGPACQPKRPRDGSWKLRMRNVVYVGWPHDLFWKPLNIFWLHTISSRATCTDSGYRPKMQSSALSYHFSNLSPVIPCRLVCRPELSPVLCWVPLAPSAGAAETLCGPPGLTALRSLPLRAYPSPRNGVASAVGLPPLTTWMQTDPSKAPRARRVDRRV